MVPTINQSIWTTNPSLSNQPLKHPSIVPLVPQPLFGTGCERCPAPALRLTLDEAALALGTWGFFADLHGWFSKILWADSKWSFKPFKKLPVDIYLILFIYIHVHIIHRHLGLLLETYSFVLDDAMTGHAAPHCCPVFGVTGPTAQFDEHSSWNGGIIHVYGYDRESLVWVNHLW